MPHPKNNNIFLVGLMGAGKTTIGRLLARKLDKRFVDSDHEIEARTGASIPWIFEIEGEACFRRREADVIRDLTAQHGLVLATGGGAVLDPQTREALRERGFVVHLHVTPDQQLQRLARDRSRPLLARPDREAVLHELARLREPLYAQVADLRFDTGCLTAAAATEQLARLLERHWQRSSTPIRTGTGQ